MPFICAKLEFLVSVLTCFFQFDGNLHIFDKAEGQTDDHVVAALERWILVEFLVIASQKARIRCGGFFHISGH